MAAEGTDQPINSGASLDLAFDWLKPVIRDQLRTAEALDNKASVMFALTTAMLAAGASFGIGNLTCDSVFAFIAGGFGLAVYFASVAAFYNSARLRNFQSLNDPRKIRSEWLSLSARLFQTNHDRVHGGAPYDQREPAEGEVGAGEMARTAGRP